MAKIQANSSGTRTIEVTEKHLQTLEHYQLFRDLIESHGYVDEQVLDRLKMNVRALLEAQSGTGKDLLDLCLDVVYNPNMKAYGLQQLYLYYMEWQNRGDSELGMTKRAYQGTPFN